MFKFRILILVLLFFTSCSTLFVNKNHEVYISSNPSMSQIQLKDSVYDLPLYLNIERSKEDLYVKLIADTLTKNYIMKPSLTSSFLYGNLAWNFVCPAAYLIDSYSPKKFYYGKYIYLDLYDTITIIEHKPSKIYSDYFSNVKETNPGHINLNFTFPLINNFYVYPENEPLKSKTGSLGISLGLDYFYKKRKFINFSASAVMDVSTIAEQLDYVDEESLRSLSFNLTDNFKPGRFSFGYGINYSIHSWYHSYYDQIETPSPIHNSETKTKQSIGLTVNGYHRIWKNLHVGIEYRPTFINVSPELNFKYEHVLSFGMAFRIRIKK